MSDLTSLETLIYLPALLVGCLAWLAGNSRLWLRWRHPGRSFPAPGFQAFAFIFSCYYLTSLFALNFSKDLRQQQILLFGVHLLALGAAFTFWKNSNIPFPKGSVAPLKQFFFSLIHFATLYPLLLVALTLNSQWVESHHPMIEFLIESPLSIGEFAFFCAGTAIIIPLFEEVLYRGFLQSGMQKIVGFTPALIGQCLLFTLLHPPHSYLPIFLFACALTCVTRWSQNLLPAIFMHILFNGLTCLELSVHRYGAWWQ